MEPRQNEGKKISFWNLIISETPPPPPPPPSKKTTGLLILLYTLLQNKRPRLSILIQTKLKQKNKILKYVSMLASGFFP